MKIVLVTGGFDPLHSGHIEYFKAAKELGTILCVGINSDSWLSHKKGQPFMPFEERKSIVENIKCVGHTFAFNDNDGSAIDAIRYVKEYFPNNSEIIFANGGDRTKDNIPEMVFDDVEFVFGVGGEHKKNSSSWILKEWMKPKTQRDWGYYKVLHEDGCETKVKELIVKPHNKLSMQKHAERNELWMVTSGNAKVVTHEDGQVVISYYRKHDIIKIPVNSWHQLINNTDEELRVVEIQYGKNCIEDDIERKKDINNSSLVIRSEVEDGI